MFNLHRELYKFHQDHVRLSSKQRQELAGYRDTNFSRLKDGLDELAYFHPVRKCDQGSYAMHTTNQHPEGEFDIDVAIIFNKEDLPSSSLESRKRIEKAMKEGGGNFKKPPEARTNAVTVWYKEGHHVDLAIHRRSFDILDNEIIEHAGVEWVERDPIEITDWFNNRVRELSPSNDGASVEDGQMRRIVRLLKFFTKSRDSWQESGKTLPGGLIISTLVGGAVLYGDQCYCPDPHSDEKALFNTITAIHNKLDISTEVYNPVDRSQKLTYKDEYKNQVKRFKEKLGKALEWLEPLQDSKGDKEATAKAWEKFFKHQYWTDLVEEINETKSRGEALKNSSFITSSVGNVSTTRLSEQDTEVPPHRYYGD
jgi:hypothetical protein